MRKQKILLADAQALVYIGQSHLLSGSFQYDIVGQAKNSAELKSAMKRLKPDVVVIDFHYPGVFSADDIHDIYSKHPSTRILVVTANENVSDVKKLMAFGVKNYILKKCNEQEFLYAVEATSKGESYLCKSVEKLLTRAEKETNAPQSILSEREIEIIGLIAKGFSSKEIAARLHLSEYTIGTHRKNMLKKLQIGKSSELVMYAVKAGLILTGA